MKALVFILILSSLSFAQKKQTPSAPQQDTTSVWVKRADAIKFFQQKREELRLELATRDAYYSGQLDLINSITQDSVKIRK